MPKIFLAYAHESRPDPHVSDVAVHTLSAGMLLLALFCTILHLVHRKERRDLRLLHEPGTFASAVALMARTPTAELLDGQKAPEDVNEALQNHRFRIDPGRMNIVTEDTVGQGTKMRRVRCHRVWNAASTGARKVSTNPIKR
jgi:hypothetical protein